MDSSSCQGASIGLLSVRMLLHHKVVVIMVVVNHPNKQQLHFVFISAGHVLSESLWLRFMAGLVC